MHSSWEHAVAQFSPPNPWTRGSKCRPRGLAHLEAKWSLSALPSAPPLASPSLAALVVADASTQCTAWRKTMDVSVAVDSYKTSRIPIYWLVIRDSHNDEHPQIKLYQTIDNSSALQYSIFINFLWTLLSGRELKGPYHSPNDPWWTQCPTPVLGVLWPASK